jgi:hypothetical protein
MKQILKISRDALKCSPKFTMKQAHLYARAQENIPHTYKLQEMTLQSV